jgi:serine/threonine protein kinase
MSPEVINKKYTELCDVWSVGVIAYMCITGFPPFRGQGREGIFQSILEGKLEFNGS